MDLLKARLPAVLKIHNSGSDLGPRLLSVAPLVIAGRRTGALVLPDQVAGQGHTGVDPGRAEHEPPVEPVARVSGVHDHG